MIPVSGARSVRATDIAGGHLVTCKCDHNFELALIVTGATGQKGVLLLTGREQFQYFAVSAYCLDLGVPIFQWSFAPPYIADATRSSPRLGYLIVQTERILIVGIGVDRNLYQTTRAWDLATGAMTDVDLPSAIYLTAWDMGVRNASRQFQALLTYPAAAAAVQPRSP